MCSVRNSQNAMDVVRLRDRCQPRADSSVVRLCVSAMMWLSGTPCATRKS